MEKDLKLGFEGRGPGPGERRGRECERGRASHGVVGVAPLGHDGMEVPP